MGNVFENDALWICKRQLRLIKRNAMLLLIIKIFLIIPFKRWG